MSRNQDGIKSEYEICCFNIEKNSTEIFLLLKKVYNDKCVYYVYNFSTVLRNFVIVKKA